MSSDTAVDPGDSIEGAEADEEVIEEFDRKRSLSRTATIVVAAVAIAFSAFQMWIAARGFVFELPLPFVENIQIVALQPLQRNAIHVSFALVLAFLLFPTATGSGRIGRTASQLADRTGIPERIRSGVRWALFDGERERVTPADGVLIGLTLLIPIYMVRQFDEVRQLRATGISTGRPIGEVYPILEPIVSAVATLGIPLDTASYAYILGVVGILLVLEATRRALGLFLTSLVAMFIVYARWGHNIPSDITGVGVLSIPQLTWESIVTNLWYTSEGIFGVPISVSVRFVFIFILFGAFLEMSGAGKWFIELAYSATGTRKGGPAKSSVVASGFMGMLSGSSVANTVTTGAFTIPLMKRSGYSPEFSGAVESTASSGGQILPPVMGAAAFLIVEYTLTPFADVITAAAVPAVAFFFGVWVMVHFEASKRGVGGLDRSELVGVRNHLREGWFYLVPLLLLLHFLVIMRYSVARSAWLTLVAIMALVALIAAYNERTRVPLIGTITGLFAFEFAAYFLTGGGITALVSNAVVGSELPGALALDAAFMTAAGSLGTITILVSLAYLLVRPRTHAPLLDLDPSVDETADELARAAGRPTLASNKPFLFGTFMLRSMDSGARTATTVVIALAAAGVIPGVISVSGLGFNLTQMIIAISGGSVIILLLVTGVAAIILGLGMPTTVMYIILVAMLGPAIEEFGFALLAAHLFILYFGLMADVTPPVAVAAYAAAGIAKAEEFETAVKAFLLSLNKILVPFAFIFSPGILLLDTRGEEATVIGLSHVLEVGYFIPEVLIPIIGVFIGVIALGITIIGYYYGSVTSTERTVFAIASVFLMAPQLLLLPAETAFGLVGIPAAFNTVELDLAMRAVGLVMFVTFTLKHRRMLESETTASPTPTTED